MSMPDMGDGGASASAMSNPAGSELMTAAAGVGVGAGAGVRAGLETLDGADFDNRLG